MKDGADPGFSLFDFTNRLTARGWQVPAYLLPADCQDQAIQRILVRHGVSRDLATLLLKDMQAALDYLAKHPLQESLTDEDSSGFHH